MHEISEQIPPVFRPFSKTGRPPFPQSALRPLRAPQNREERFRRRPAGPEPCSPPGRSAWTRKRVTWKTARGRHAPWPFGTRLPLYKPAVFHFALRRPAQGGGRRKSRMPAAHSSTAPRAALVTSLAYRARYPVLYSPWAGTAAPWGPN